MSVDFIRRVAESGIEPLSREAQQILDGQVMFKSSRTLSGTLDKQAEILERILRQVQDLPVESAVAVMLSWMGHERAERMLEYLER